jgi:hypothetical protein
MASEPATAINLTAIAERLPCLDGPRLDGPRRTVRVLESAASGGLAFEVQARDGAEDWPEEPGDRDAVYVVISGEGALRCGGETLECAAGDVLFAPAGAPRRFERLSRGFSTWRILLGAPAAAGGGRGGDAWAALPPKRKP